MAKSTLHPFKNELVSPKHTIGVYCMFWGNKLINHLKLFTTKTILSLISQGPEYVYTVC